MLAIYIVKRLLMAFLVIVFVMAMLASIVHLVPGDPARIILKQQATPELIASVRAQMGLDDPLHVQVWDFIAGAVQGDLGTDFTNQAPVSQLIVAELPDTASLALASVLLSMLFGVPLGVLAARHANTWIDRAIGAFSMGLVSSFSFIAGLGLLLVFAVQLGWVPALGAGEPGDPLDYATRLVLPALALALAWIGYLARFMRASMLEVMGSNYIRAARAFGFRERIIFYRLALKNALAPIVALFGLMLGSSLGGTVYAEWIFSRPGLGSLSIEAINQRNWPVVRGTVLVYAIFFIVGNLLSDLSYRFVDPRIRVEEGQEAPT